jgi:hypothetical protein
MARGQAAFAGPECPAGRKRISERRLQLLQHGSRLIKGAVMTDENQERTAARRADQLYEAPKVIRVSLRPDEAVLGNCKVTGVAGPVATSCSSFHCNTLGS